MHSILMLMVGIAALLALLGMSLAPAVTPRPESWDYSGGDMGVLPNNNDYLALPDSRPPPPSSTTTTRRTTEPTFGSEFLCKLKEDSQHPNLRENEV